MNRQRVGITILVIVAAFLCALGVNFLVLPGMIPQAFFLWLSVPMLFAAMLGVYLLLSVLDRYIIRSFLVNYLLALGVLVGMYILMDLIVNFDNFTKAASNNPESGNQGAAAVLYGIVDYYMYQFLAIFQYVSAAIPLLAAGFTMFRMTRHFELTAMLASGVSLFRVAMPIILVSVFFSLLNITNQEFVISQDYIVQKLLRQHGEYGVTLKNDRIDFVRDEKDNSLLMAGSYDWKKKQMTGVAIIERSETNSHLRDIVAETATWQAPMGDAGEEKPTWVLVNAMQIDDIGQLDPSKQVAGRVPVMIRTGSITPEQLDLKLQRKAVDYLSSTQIRRLAAAPMETNKGPLYKVMYLRFTQPMMNIIMLLIGIPFLLTREPARLIKNMMFCVVVVGVVFGASFAIFSLNATTLDPLWSAWLPVLIFGPLSIVMMDTIRT